MKRAFTLIELLVVIAIIAILAAILFPVFAQAKEAAKKTQCLSNNKNMATASIMYLSDNDDTYPYDHWMSLDNGFTQDYWINMIMPYVKNGDTGYIDANNKGALGKGGIFTCPDFPDKDQTSQYGPHGGISPDGYMFFNGPAGSNNPPPPTNQSQIDQVASTIYIAEKGLNNQKHDPPGDNWGYTNWETGEWAWTDTVMVAGVPTRQNKHYDLDYDCDAKVRDNGWPGWPNCSAMPRYRHNRSTNVSFCDGHAKGMTKGSIDWFKNIYISKMGNPY